MLSILEEFYEQISYGPSVMISDSVIWQNTEGVDTCSGTKGPDEAVLQREAILSSVT